MRNLRALALGGLFAAGLLTCPLAAAEEQEVYGAPLIPGAKLIEPGRYSSPRNYTETILFFQRFYKSKGGIRWTTIAHLPSVKAKHISSTLKKTLWEGVNIYETNGEVRLYYLPRSKSPQGKTPTGKAPNE
jgi:hypothetical protein